MKLTGILVTTYSITRHSTAIVIFVLMLATDIVINVMSAFVTSGVYSDACAVTAAHRGFRAAAAPRRITTAQSPPVDRYGTFPHCYLSSLK